MTRTQNMLMFPDEYRVMFEHENTYWWYQGMRWLLKALMKDHLPADLHGAMILDAGCGTGANLQLLRSYGRAIGVDISTEAIYFCHARGISGDCAFAASVADLPFPDAVFDLVTSFDVVCNISNDGHAFAEIARVLKPGGRLVVQLPAYQGLWSAHDVAVGHQRRYGDRDAREKMLRAGLQVERMLHANVALLPFIAIERLWRRRALKRGRAVASDLQMPLPQAVNKWLARFYCAEVTLALRLNCPVGLSLIAIAKKR